MEHLLNYKDESGKHVLSAVEGMKAEIRLSTLLERQR
jgi:hypothetical protein